MSCAYHIDVLPVTKPESPSADGDTVRLLESAAGQLRLLGPEFAGHVRKLESLQERLSEQRFHLAVLGQFKRGKSTLLNALIGEALLPSAVVPLTAVPTFLRWGPRLEVRVLYQGENREEHFASPVAEEVAAFLARFVTEQGNPRNRLRVMQAEVACPSSLLERGVVLIDTPGIGSTLQHNTQTALDFLPECDAALFVVSADPPLTQAEVEFLKEVRAKVPRLFFVLNKVDYLDRQEQDELVSFLRRVLEREGIPGSSLPIFPVSARQGLAAARARDAEAWQQSGLADLEMALLEFLRREKQEVLGKAIALKAAAIVSGALEQMRFTLRSLELPLADLESRACALEVAVQEAQAQLVAAKDLLRGDRERATAFLEEQAAALRERTEAHLQLVATQALQASASAGSERAVEEALAAAIPAFFEKELEAFLQLLQEHTATTLRGHQERANALIERVRSTAAELFDIPYQAPESSEAFVASHRPFWVTRKFSPVLMPFAEEAIAKLLPNRVRRARLERRLASQIESLARHNVENLRWAALQDLNESFRQFGLALDERLQETIACTQGAVLAARRRREEQAELVAQEKERLVTAEAALARCWQQLRELAAG